MEKKMEPETYKKWEELIDSIEKERIPVEFIEKMVVRLQGRKRKSINVKNLMNKGMTPDEVEEEISSQMAAIDEEMTSVDFMLDIEGIASIVQPQTDRLLACLK
jgi:hypothetical protein